MAAVLELSDEEIPPDSHPLMVRPILPNEPRRWLPMVVKLILCAAVLFGPIYVLTSASGSQVASSSYPGIAKHITALASKDSDASGAAALVKEVHDLEAEVDQLKTDMKAEVAKLKTEVKSLEAHQQAAVVSPSQDATTSDTRDVNATKEGLLPLGPNEKRPFCVDPKEMQVQLVRQEVELQEGRCQALNGTNFSATALCKVQAFHMKARLAATKGGPIAGGAILVFIIGLLASIAPLAAVALSVYVLFFDNAPDASGTRALGISELGSWARSAPLWLAGGESVKVKGQAAVTLLLPLAFLLLGLLVSLLFRAAAGSSQFLLGIGACLIYRAMHLETVFAVELAATQRSKEEEALAPKQAATNEDAVPNSIWGFIPRDLRGPIFYFLRHQQS